MTKAREGLTDAAAGAAGAGLWLLRALLWPGLVALMGGLAWMGGRVVQRPRSAP